MRRNKYQMHSVAQNITRQITKKVSTEFGMTFEYKRAFFGILNGEPVTIEEFIKGNFSKYVNNNGECVNTTNEDEKTIYQIEIK